MYPVLQVVDYFLSLHLVKPLHILPAETPTKDTGQQQYNTKLRIKENIAMIYRQQYENIQ